MERRVGALLHEALRLARRRSAAGAALGRHLPRRRRAAAARVRGAHRPGASFTHPRPRRRRGPDGPGAAASSAWRATQKRFPLKGTCLAIYSRVVNSQARRCATCWPTHYPVVRRVGRRAASGCSRAYVDAKQQQHVLDYDDLLLYWWQMMAEPALAARHRRALRPRAGRRVPGHQPAAGARSCRRSSPTAAASRWSATTRSRSTRSAAPRCATSSTFRRSFTPPARIVTLERNYRSTQPILDGVERGDRAGRASATPRRCGPTASSAQRPQLVDGARRGGAGALGGRPGAARSARRAWR